MNTNTKQLFKNVAAFPENENWEKNISRIGKFTANNEFEIRSEFERDYNRIINCCAYSRLKHKTQVFFATDNDHVCTRIEHVNYVASISKSIAKYLGLNTELVEAISLGHDLGHSPFGHHGERIIIKIMEEEGFRYQFWHEYNSLRFVDDIETLPNQEGWSENLNLTYAVRDGIVSHCGEVDENALIPRKEFIDLREIKKGQYMPFTYEGCVVKISDKIAYLGRDLQDAALYNFFDKNDYLTLRQIAENIVKEKVKLKEINTTYLMHKFILDLCENSTPETGLNFSQENYELMRQIKKFNFEKICMNRRLKPFMEYANLVLRTLYNFLKDYYADFNTISNLAKDAPYYREIIKSFCSWLIKYSNIDTKQRVNKKYKNKIIYNMENEMDYKQAIIDYISSMTDKFAIKVYEELITF